jgi:type I restriction-modification system DNA methylase subunit
MSEMDIALQRIAALVDTFHRNESRYKSAKYSEAEARKDFIDKFWIALGWDVNHDQQTNPYEQEVKVERGVATGGSQRRADYAFYLVPNFHDVRFFVEAKKPFVEIGTKENYFQLIRYGWNSETPLAVLSDFEQFHILDCRYKPDVDTALNRCLAKYHYTDYANRDKFSQIYWLFSREAVASGSLEKRAKELPKPRGRAKQRGLFPGGYQSIDESFLAELDEYRTSLARNFKNHNPELDSETLTELAQRTLDRLVFLRFLEDKGIEAQRLVERFGEKGTVWEDFIAASHRLDGIYNGIVYRPHDILDDADFCVDEHAFGHICESLAHVNSPYDFNAIPIHILGSIYERFLGKVIVTTDHRAKVVEKPEVRKAGGVYYTPEYIVRYIVENTVGTLIAGKTPDEIAGMRFADIACGSGSFLLGVFDLLLSYHGHYYNEHPGKAHKGDCIARDGKLFVSLRKKREILLNNIYGVDIDAQAVEVCQLSLYLKLLQEETEASARQYLLDFEHTARMKKVLPDLGKNIVCGNSLIGTDILNSHLFAGDEERKLNPMNFEDAFPEIMKRGGFDAIVGNPPWGGDIDKQLDYFHQTYPATTQEHTDSFKLFIDRALRLVRNGGLTSMIAPSTILRQRRLKDVRSLMLQNRIRLLTDLGEGVFHGVVAPTCVFVIEHGEPSPNHKVSTMSVSQVPSSEKAKAIARNTGVAEVIAQRSFLENPDFAFAAVRMGCMVPVVKLGDFSALECKDAGINYQRVSVGMQEKGKSDLSERLLYEGRREKPEHQMYWKGSDIDRYLIAPKTNRFCRPNYWDFIRRNEVVHLNEDVYNWTPKILLRQTADRIIATIDSRGIWFGRSIIAIIAPRTSQYRIEYFLGLLNSRYFEWLYAELVHETGRVFAQVKLSKIKQLPIRVLNFSDTADTSRHDEMVGKVEAMLQAKKQFAKAKTDKEKTYYENRCAGLDRQIDRLVYELYGLTEDEIRIVEESRG